jgi:MFS family permease
MATPGTPGYDERAGSDAINRVATPALLARVTLAACLIFWAFVFCDSGWGPLLVPLAARLHISLTTAGLFYVIWSTGYLPGALIGGAMLDRYGPRRVLLAASLIVLTGMACIYLGLLFPNNVSTIVLLIIAGLAGTGGGVIDASTNGLISATYAEKRGAALNLFNLLYPLAGVLVALIDSALLRIFHNDPRPSIIFTLCYIACAIFSLFGVPGSYRLELPAPLLDTPDTETIALPDQPSTPLLKTLLPVIVVMLLMSGISSSVRAWTPAYLHVAFGQTPAAAAALSSVTWLLATVSRLGAAILILRTGNWRMVMLGVVVTIIGLIGLLLSPNPLDGTLAIAVASIGLSPIFATCVAIGSELAGRAHGSVAGILLFAAGASTVGCSWLFGYLLNSIGPQWAVAFSLACMGVGGLLALRLRPDRG